MPTAAEHASILRLPIDEVIKLAERAVVNTASTTFASIEMDLMQKLLACKRATEVERVRQPQRVYVQHAVEAADRALIRATFPKWDIKFSGVDPRANAKAHAIYYVMAQFLLDKLDQKKGTVLAFGVSLKQIIMRNRKWMHVCIPGQDVVEQAEFRRDDRAIVVMAKSLERSGKTYDLARDFAEGNSDCYCGDPRVCDRQAVASIMMLHRTNTNFRQVAYYMRKHGTKLLYFAIPGSKHMEFASAGPIPELGAYVFPTTKNGKTQVNVTYNGDVSLDVSYDYDNYLELVGRTSVVLGDTCYHKEHVIQILGVHVYKVTAFPAENVDEKLPAYFSWNEPLYKNLYVVRVPLLRPGGTMQRREDWEMYTYNVERDVIDSVADWAMRADGVSDMSKQIERRLTTKLSRVAGHGQVIPVNAYMAVDEFDLTALVIFVTTFMRKYVHGRTVAVVAPQARELAHLCNSTFFSLARQFLYAKMSAMSGLFGKMAASWRAALFDHESDRELPLPTFVAAMGYTAYDNAAFNPMFNGWDKGDGPVDGFSPSLPGVKPMRIESIAVHDATTESSHSLSYSIAQKLLSVGEAVLTGDGRIRVNGCDDDYRISQPAVSFSDKVAGWITGAIVSASDTSSYVDLPESFFKSTPESSEFDPTEMTELSPIEDVRDTDMDVVRASRNVDLSVSHEADYAGASSRYELRIPQTKRFRSTDPEVLHMTHRVYQDTEMLSTLAEHELQISAMFDEGKVPDIVPGAVSDDPVQDLVDAMNIIFPGSTTINTRYFESDKQFTDYHVKIKSTKLALDMSKMGVLKPEAFFRPVVRSHAVPDAKNNHVDTLFTINKRYANTPADAGPLDQETVFAIAWAASLIVYYLPGTEQMLEDAPFVGPTWDTILEWFSNLEPEKRQKLEADPKTFSLMDLLHGLMNNQFMNKGKHKADLTHTYMSSSKVSQGIQYDPTGKSTAVFTPMYSAKIQREQSMLRPNVLVMQRKNLNDVNVFLNRFDWRPNERGERYYVEIDYGEYDKSQGTMARTMHWKKMQKMKVLPDYLEFFKAATTNRSVSAIKAGIKAWLSEQTPSGLSNTLDSNTDVNMLAVAELLLKISTQLEFVMVMGDDMTLAVRGHIDISGWESEINRKFNLSMKIGIHRHGYICSMDIIHYPDGHSAVAPDIVKRAVAYTQQSLKDYELLDEKWVSFRDDMQRVLDRPAQLYLQSALPGRYRYILPGLNQESVALLYKVHAKCVVDKKSYFAFFSTVKAIIFY